MRTSIQNPSSVATQRRPVRRNATESQRVKSQIHSAVTFTGELGSLFLKTSTGSLLASVSPTGQISVILTQGSGSKNDISQPELTSLDMLRAVQTAGGLSFWDDPRDDIYTLQDGEPV